MAFGVVHAGFACTCTSVRLPPHVQAADVRHPFAPLRRPALQKLLQHAPLAVDKPKFTDPHTKVNALVQVRTVGRWCA